MTKDGTNLPIFFTIESQTTSPLNAPPKNDLTMNKILLVILLLALVTISWACRKTNVTIDTFKTVGVDEFEQLIADTAAVVILDVRTLAEYQEGHIKGAILIDVKTDSFMVAAREQLPKEKTIAVYCRSGRRSATAAEMLAAEGYLMVNLDGGILAWRKADKETVTD